MTRPFTLILALALCAGTPSVAQDRPQLSRQFEQWKDDVIWPMAQAQGVTRAQFARAMVKLRPDWDLPGLHLPARTDAPPQEIQAEFGQPARYFNARSLQDATTGGRDMAAVHSATLARVEQATGVPRGIILGIWGRESAYGRAPITHDVFQVLATRGFTGPRKSYFTNELIAALRIAQTGKVAPGNMKSSWAGAMGQPQFMPSNFLQFAADGDGDGRTDIWKSPGDTIASIAKFLADHGWQKGRDWGFEVRVPPELSCALEGPDQGRRIADWADLGITRVSGRAFPAHEMRGQGFLMMPAGRNGPAFIVTPNFYVLKDYNKSDLYALFVGHVGDRIRYGLPDFHRAWGRVDSLTRAQVLRIQTGLVAQGYDVGGADGLAGFKTRRAIGLWQQSQGQKPTCFPSRALVRAFAP